MSKPILVQLRAELRGPVALSDLHLARIREFAPAGEIDPAKVYVRSAVMANDQPSVDKRLRIRTEAIVALAPMMIGQPVMRNHNTNGSDDLPVARVVECTAARSAAGVTEMIGDFIYPKDPQGEFMENRLSLGIWRESSIGAYFSSSDCSICGAVDLNCEHAPAKEYDGRLCTLQIGEPIEAEEWSIAWKGRLTNTRQLSKEQAEAIRTPDQILLAKATRMHADASWWEGMAAPQPFWT